MNTNKVNDFQIDLLYQISNVLNQQQHFNYLMNDIFIILKNILNIHYGMLCLKKEHHLVPEFMWGGENNESFRKIYLMSDSLTGKVLKTGVPIVGEKEDVNNEFFNGMSDSPFKNLNMESAFFICVPIKYFNQVIGTFSVVLQSSENFSRSSLQQLLEIIANMLAENLSLFLSEKSYKELSLAENIKMKKKEEEYKTYHIVGNCSAMRQLYTLIEQVADSSATVLIRGESGTGKELVAKAIHDSSIRKKLPFVAVNCAALPENLIESELFGHEKGSFTGALKQRKGRFELAGQGTLFLDEIGDISPNVQVKLLRVLQERSFERIGGHEPIASNARVIAATSQNLELKMANGSFREDLFYRLNIFPIYLPALRDRKSDLMLLADYFLEKYNKLYMKKIRRISTPAINMMNSYHWPGNIRELENCIERAVLMSTNNVLNAYDLPPSLQTVFETGSALTTDENAEADFQTLINSFERELLTESLKNCHGNVAAVARKLKTTERILHYKIKKLGICIYEFH